MTDKRKSLKAWENNRGRGVSNLYWQRCDNIGHIVVRLPIEMENLRGALDEYLATSEFELKNPIPNVWKDRLLQEPIKSERDIHQCILCGKSRKEVRKLILQNDECVMGACDECIRFIYENLLEPNDESSRKTKNPETPVKHPFACPICKGTGHFGYEPTTVPMPSPCRSCDGTGIVWGPPQ